MTIPHSRGIAILTVTAFLCTLPFVAANSTPIKIGGTGTALALVRALADEFKKIEPEFEAKIPPSIGSSGGIRAVLAGALDIGLSGRPLKKKEVRDGVVATLVSRSPFLLVTSMQDPEINIIKTDLAKIVTGVQELWGNGTPIRFILRPEGDRDSKLLSEYFPGLRNAMAKARLSRGIPVAVTEQDAIDLAENTVGSLTASTLTTILSEHRNLQPIAIEGVKPTLANLENGSYGLSKSLYLVLGPAATRAARDFIQFVLSPHGGAVLRRLGNIPAANPVGE